MHPGLGWIHRDELLQAVRQLGFRASNHQLLRWHDEELLPQPRRVGRGRARGGSDSYYPWWAALQAAELAGQLKRKRNLDDAGWALWVAGFPVADVVRDLLLDELEESEDMLREVLADRGGPLPSLLDSTAHARSDMWKVVHRKQRAKVLRMVTEMQLGTLQPEKYSKHDWASFQDATLAAVLPQALDDPKLPSPTEVRSGITKLSRHWNLRAVRQGLEQTDDRWFRIYTNEAQALFAMIAQSLDVENALVPRDAFLRYFAQRHVDPGTRKQTVQYLKVLGWTKPPLSPFEQFVARLRAAAPSDAGANP